MTDLAGDLESSHPIGKVSKGSVEEDRREGHRLEMEGSRIQRSRGNQSGASSAGSGRC